MKEEVDVIKVCNRRCREEVKGSCEGVLEEGWCECRSKGRCEGRRKGRCKRVVVQRAK